MDTSQEIRVSTWVGGHDALRGLLAAVLVAAAALKAHEVATTSAPETGMLTSRWLLIAVVEAEWCFALWLLARGSLRLKWCIALMCFGAFACVSGYKGFTGEISCGCFGRVPVNPWYTFCLDIATVILLIVFRPRAEVGCAAHAVALPVWLVVSAALLVGVPAAILMASDRVRSASVARQIQRNHSAVVLAPEQWEGKQFPLVELIDVGRHLTHGQWAVVLYHVGCLKCDEMINGFDELSMVTNDARGAVRVAFIEVPEEGQSRAEWPLSSSHCLRGELRDSYDWFVSTPVILAIKDGIVEEVCREQSLAGLRRMIERRYHVSWRGI